MNTRRLGVVIFFLVLQCADRIGPNDSIFDPENENGDYNFETRIVPDDDTLIIFQSYKLMCMNKGKDRLHLYQFSFDTTPPGITTSSVSDVSFSDSSDLYFTAAPYTGVLTVTAIKPNGSEIYHYDTISVVNPYRIRIFDSGLLAKGTAILASVQDTRHEQLSDEKLTVQWYRGKTAVDTLDFMLPCTLYTGTLPDTVRIHARLSDKSGHYVMLDTLKKFVRPDRFPYVDIKPRQAGVPIDTTYTIDVDSCYADKFIWKSGSIGRDTTPTPRYTHRWTSIGLVDTVIVTAMNRFGVEGNSDTILITPRAYRYGLDIIKFPTTIAGRQKVEWVVAATDTGRRVHRDSVEYVWTITPASKAETIIKNRDTLQLFCNPVSDTDSFGISVFAFRGADSSWTKYSTVKLLKFRPVIKLNPFDSSLSLNDSVTFTVKTFDTDSDSSGKIDSVYYQTTLDGGSPHLMQTSTVTVKCGRAGNQTVKFWCVDNRGFRSDTALAEIVITSTDPHFVNDPSPLTAYINDSITIAAPANPGNKESAIVEWTWDFDSDGTFDDTTTVDSITTLYTTPGIRTITAGCRNREGDTAVNHAVITIDVQDGVPSVTSVTCTTQTMFINDTAVVRIKAFDGNGKVHACSLKINDSACAAIAINPSRQTLDTLITVPMPAIGTFQFSASVTDDDTLTSPYLYQTIPVVVNLGKPTAGISFPAEVWISDMNSCTVHASDPNGTVKSRWVRWDAGSAFVKLDDSTTQHPYGVAGPYTISAFVLDDDGISSDTVHRSVTVKTGAPTFGNITVANPPHSSVFVNDPIRFTVCVSDSNDVALTVMASWNGDTAYTEQLQTTSDSAIFQHPFGRNKIGPNTVGFRVFDQDGNRAETSINVQVESGAPTVSLLSISPAPDSLYVRDTVRVRLRASDTNGVIKKICVNWNGGNAVQDSVIVNTRTLDTEFSHVYDITGGNYTVRLWAFDEDTIRSVNRDTSVFIRKCPPRLWGDTADTLWVVVDDGVGINKHYPVKPNHYDTNGTIVRYYWNSSNTLTGATITTTDTIMPPFNVLSPFDLYIFGRDDDSLLGGGKFVVFPDSAPKPITVTSDPITGGRKLSWSGLDTKDSLATEFRILVKKGSQPDTSASSPDTAKDWTPASDPAFAYTPANAKPFSWVYTPAGCASTQTCTYYFQIISRDKRGSKSYSSVGVNFDWTQP